VNPLIHTILINVVIPEIAALLRRKPGMTDAEVIAAVQQIADRVIRVGEAWLASKGLAVPIDTPPLAAPQVGGKTDG